MEATSEQNKDLVRRFEDAMNSRQLDDFDEIMTPSFVRHCEATPQVDIQSREQFKDFLRQYAAIFPDNTQTFTQVVAEGDRMGFWATYEGTQTGQMGPFPPTGRQARFSFAGVLRVEQGKLAELWVTWDNLAILTQLGHLPAAPAEEG